MEQEKFIFDTQAGAQDVGLRQYMTAVYGWMAIGIFLTGLLAVITVYTPALLNLIYGGGYGWLVLMVAEVALVFYLSSRILTMPAPRAMFFYGLYAALNGLTLSYIYLMYTHESIAGTFFITAGTFGVMSVYGFLTRRDLSSLGNILFMGLIGLIIASVVNIFLKSSALYWITTYIGVIIFVGLTAYDTQKIKQYYYATGGYDTDKGKKLALLGALALYLDFVNLFLFILRIFGRRK